jgi:Leucine-rich repeat (LRR) protein
VVLNLANNRITVIDNQAFCCVPNLLWLNLAGNPLLRINPDTFLGVKNQLESLNVANASLTLLPSFQLPSLKELNISYNQVSHLLSLKIFRYLR